MTEQEKEVVRGLNSAGGFSAYDRYRMGTSTLQTFNISHKNIYKEISVNTVKTFLRDTNKHMNEVISMMDYFYRSTPEISQLYNNVRNLPNLESYKVSVIEKTDKHETNLVAIRKAMKSVKYKKVTRDILFQAAKQGTVISIWLGSANKTKTPFLYTFDNLDLCFPHHIKNGEWIAALDLSKVDSMEETPKENFLDAFSGVLTRQRFNEYTKQRNKDLRYFPLPQERTSVVRFNAEALEQFGLPMGIFAVYDLLHKKQLKDLEKAVANNIIGSVFVLTIGKDGQKDYHPNDFSQLPDGMKRDLHANVKTALNEQQEGIKVVGLPNSATLDTPDLKVEKTLEPEKYSNINKDISTGIGIPSAVMNGEGGNYQSAKLGLENFYKQIGALLEIIEEETYNKLINLIVLAKDKDNYSIEFNKQMPLPTNDLVSALQSLHTSEGYSLRHVIERLGINFEEYVEQSIYEQEELQLQERIKPPENAHTSSGSESTKGRPSIEDPENENTAKNKANQN